MDVNGDAPRFTRTWFGDIFFGCWGLFVLVNLTRAMFGWDRGGLLYWLIVGPLGAGFLGAGIPWLVLVVRDFVRSPGQVWNEASPRIAAVVGVMVLAFVAGQLLS
jgi:hypothetical protein